MTAEEELICLREENRVLQEQLGAEAFCRIRGYLSTLRKQGMSLLTALEQALLGHPVSPAF